MTEQASAALQSILQIQDNVCVTLEAYLFTTADSISSTWIFDELEWQARSKRFLSVVTHQDDLGSFEEGGCVLVDCILVFYCMLRIRLSLASVFITRATQDGVNAELELHRLFPIVHDFAVSTAQKKQGSWDQSLPPLPYSSGPSV
jgi:hypothetical protein